MLGRLQPIGFWSYARQDEESARGKLSSLRARLQGELQQQYGRDQIRIFQDVAAIAPGDSWDRELRDAIQNSTFLVPIITPAFLESEWCCQEIKLFLAREAELNAAHPQLKDRSRIFPIHYIDISNAEPFDPDVLPLLQTRQWLDFRSMRFSPEDDPKVQMTLSTLAQGMNELLQVRVELPEFVPPPPVARAAAKPRSDQQVPPRAASAPLPFAAAQLASVAAEKPWYMKPAALVGGGVLAGIFLIVALAVGADDTVPDTGAAVETTAVEPGGAGAAGADPAETATDATAEPDGAAAAAAAPAAGYTVTGAAALFAAAADSRSVGDGSSPIKVVFDNQTDDELDLFWIDFAGKPRHYQTVAPHTYYEIETYRQHVWRLARRNDGQFITALLPPATGGQVDITR